MAQSDNNFKRYLDAGVAFTQMTRERAEEIAKDLVKQGEVRRKEAEAFVEEMLERSRRNTEELVGIVRGEVARQLQALGLEELARRAKPSGATSAKASAPKKAATAAKSTTKKAAKSTAKKAPAKAASATSSTVKKAAAKKAPAKKAATAKKSSATKKA